MISFGMDFSRRFSPFDDVAGGTPEARTGRPATLVVVVWNEDMGTDEEDKSYPLV
jgi:hypothetical protein